MHNLLSNETRCLSFLNYKLRLIWLLTDFIKWGSSQFDCHAISWAIVDLSPPDCTYHKIIILLRNTYRKIMNLRKYTCQTNSYVSALINIKKCFFLQSYRFYNVTVTDRFQKIVLGLPLIYFIEIFHILGWKFIEIGFYFF